MKTLTDKPFISILLPVHNGATFLPECIESILKQSYETFEIIAIDDFSHDNSYKLLKFFRRMDKRVKIYQNVKHYGMAMTLNRAIKRSKGQFLVFMDQEDICYKEKLKKQLLFLQNNPKVVAVGTQCTYMNAQGKRIGKSNFPDEAKEIYNKPLHGVSMQFQTLMINRFNLPKDLPYFPTNGHPYLYSNIFLTMLAFGELRNLPHPPLQYHRRTILKPNITLDQMPQLMKLWIQSIANNNYRPSLRYLSNILLRTFTPAQ